MTNEPTASQKPISLSSRHDTHVAQCRVCQDQKMHPTLDDNSLQERAATIQALLESASQSILTVDREGKVVFANAMAENSFGFGAGELVGQPVESLLPASLRDHHVSHRKGFFAQPHERPMGKGRDLMACRKNGTEFPVEIALNSIETRGGMLAVAFITDITERKQAKLAVATSEIRYRRLFEASQDGILILDAITGEIVDSNPFIENLLGYSHEKMLGQTIWDIGLFKDIERSKAAFKKLQVEGNVRYENLPLVGKDGRLRNVEFISNTYPVNQKEVIQCNIRDITERVQAEGLLREKAEMQEQLSNVIATVPGAVFSFQMLPDGTAFFPFASSRVRDIFNLPPEDLKRDATAAFATVHPDDLAPLQAAIKDSFQRLAPFHAEFRVRHSERGTIWAEINSLPVRQPAGGVIWHGFTTDITARKELESQFRQAQKMEAIGQLTGGIAHDFNNLLAVILGNLDLLERLVAGNEAAIKRVQTAQKAATRGADLTRRLLGFSSRQHLNPEPAHLDELIQSTIDMASRVLGSDIGITTTFDKAIPPVFVDVSGLENTVLNLAVNARDAMPNGGSLTISTSLRDLDENYPPVQVGEIKPGRYARVSVSDTGQGMSRETLQRVFEPFFTTKPRGKGTGLGLAMVYGFVKQSGGIVRIYSELGHGTTVSFYLPLAEGIPLPARGVGEMKLQAKTAGTLLVVDDEVDLLEVAVSYAEEMGYRVLHATDGPSALAVVAREPGIKLLVTDIIMPGRMNGVELASKLRQMIPSLKVIYSSGFPADALAERGGTRLDGPLLSKPYHRNEFVATLSREMASSNDELAEEGAIETRRV